MQRAEGLVAPPPHGWVDGMPYYGLPLHHDASSMPMWPEAMPSYRAVPSHHYPAYHMPPYWTTDSRRSSAYDSPQPETSSQQAPSRLGSEKPSRRRASRASSKSVPPRKCLSRDDRIEICEFAQAHPTATQKFMGVKFGVERSTISKTLLNKEQYLTRSNGDFSIEPKKHKGKFKDIAKTLANWAKNEESMQKRKLSDQEIRDRAMTWMNSTHGNVDPKFKADLDNPTWFEDFKTSNQIGTPNDGVRPLEQTPSTVAIQAAFSKSTADTGVLAAPAHSTEPMALKMEQNARSFAGGFSSSVAAYAPPVSAPTPDMQTATPTFRPVLYDDHQAHTTSHSADYRMRSQTYPYPAPIISHAYHSTGYVQQAPPFYQSTMPPPQWAPAVMAPPPPPYSYQYQQLPQHLEQPQPVPVALNGYTVPEHEQATPCLSYAQSSPAASLSMKSEENLALSIAVEVPSISEAEAALDTIKRFCDHNRSQLRPSELQVIRGLDKMYLRPPLEEAHSHAPPEHGIHA